MNSFTISICSDKDFRSHPGVELFYFQQISSEHQIQINSETTFDEFQNKVSKIIGNLKIYLFYKFVFHRSFSRIFHSIREKEKWNLQTFGITISKL